MNVTPCGYFDRKEKLENYLVCFLSGTYSIFSHAQEITGLNSAAVEQITLDHCANDIQLEAKEQGLVGLNFPILKL